MSEQQIYSEPNATSESEPRLSEYEAAHWREYANCGPETTALFFAADSPETKVRITAAKRICAECTVAEYCLNEALDNNERFGIWGGLTVNERKRKVSSEKTVHKKAAPPPENTVHSLSNEKQWERQYDALEDEVVAYSITKLVHRKSTWIRAKAAEFGMEGSEKMVTGRNRTVYPKLLALEIHRHDLEIPDAGRWLTAYALEKQLGMDRGWIVERLKEQNIVFEERRTPGGNIHDHYPPRTRMILKRIIETLAPPAGNWLTAHEIVPIVGRSFDWVEHRIAAKYARTGEYRRASNGKALLHYSPAVIEALELESERERMIPPAGRLIAMRALTELVGHTEKWVKPRIPFVSIPPEIRMHETLHRPLPHYDPDIAEELNALPSHIGRG